MEIQIFIGVNLTQQLEASYALHSPDTLFIEEHLHQKYLGFFIPYSIISISHLNNQKQTLCSYLNTLLINTKHFSISNIPITIFPKLIIGSFHKYAPNPE